MITPLDVPPELREMLYIHEVLRVGGVAADDIYVNIVGGGFVVEVHRDGKPPRLIAGIQSSMPSAMFLTMWPVAVELWNDTCNTDATWGFQQSEARKNAVLILAAAAMP